MAIGPPSRVPRHLQALFDSGPAGDLADGVLLDRFVLARDEAAFEVLVARHGPMVLSVCRAALGDRDAADDAFQAVFLVLVRRAASIRSRGSIASWLFGVASRVAARAGRGRPPPQARTGGLRGETGGCAGGFRRSARPGPPAPRGAGAAAGPLPRGDRAVLLRGTLLRCRGASAPPAGGDRQGPAVPGPGDAAPAADPPRRRPARRAACGGLRLRCDGGRGAGPGRALEDDGGVRLLDADRGRDGPGPRGLTRGRSAQGDVPPKAHAHGRIVDRPGRPAGRDGPDRSRVLGAWRRTRAGGTIPGRAGTRRTGRSAARRQDRRRRSRGPARCETSSPSR